MDAQQTFKIEKLNPKQDFQKYLLNIDEFNRLSENCVSGEIMNFNCRWAAWRVYLGLLPIGDEAAMRSEVRKQRNFYTTEYDKFMNFRSKVQLSADVDNPLSTNSSNPWNSFYTDNEIKEEIKKDIERTYQDVDFFLSKSVQILLSNILFVWAKQNSDLSYRQGMNEIVAVLTYVCFTENYKPQNPEQDICDYLYDEKFAEADIYTMFKKIMELDQKAMFTVNQPNSNKSKQKKKVDSDGVSRPNLPVVHRAAYIQEQLLPQLQPYVFNHFKTLLVEPHIYMMRWLRCMLAREFKLSQTLHLWDSIFGFHFKYTPGSKQLKMLDYLCIGMILNISEELFLIDNGGMVLGKLLKYPPIENISYFIMTCHNEILSNLHLVDLQTSSGSQGLVPENKDSTPLSGQDDEVQSASNQSPTKKLVLFNPEMSMFKTRPKKAQPVKKSSDKPSESADPLNEPLIKKASDNTNQNKLASNDLTPQKPKSPIDSMNGVDEVPKQNGGDSANNQPKIKTLPEKKEDSGQSEPFTYKKENKTVLFAPSKTDTKSPALLSSEKSKANNFFPGEQKSTEKPKEGPMFFVEKPKTTSNAFNKDTKPVEPISGASHAIHKDSAECMKKLQNAIKLIQLENEKSPSLELEEALGDLHAVMKIVKEKLSKN